VAGSWAATALDLGCCFGRCNWWLKEMAWICGLPCAGYCGWWCGRRWWEEEMKEKVGGEREANLFWGCRSATIVEGNGGDRLAGGLVSFGRFWFAFGWGAWAVACVEKGKGRLVRGRWRWPGRERPRKKKKIKNQRRAAAALLFCQVGSAAIWVKIGLGLGLGFLVSLKV